MPPPLQPDANEPLDPAAERLRQRLVRLLAVSFGVMALGLIAVFGAILYRLNAAGATPTGIHETTAGSGGSVAAAVLSEDRLAITLATPDGKGEVLLLDARTGRLVARIRP